MEAMSRNGMTGRWVVFDRCRQRLYRIAYRILHSKEDAEDMVQETSVRWAQADLARVRTPVGWLVSVITRLAIDQRRRAARERGLAAQEPDLAPVGSYGQTAPNRPVELRSDLVRALILLRERLGPTERAAFVLRELFEYSYDEMAHVLQKSAVACRQIVHRARRRIHRERPGLVIHQDAAEDLAERFQAALWTGDREVVLALLTEDAAEGSAVTGAGRTGRRGPVRRRLRPSPRPDGGSWDPDLAEASPAA